MNYKNLDSSWFFFKYSILKKNALQCFKEALRNQYLSIDELEHLNWERTKNLLLYAYDKVPYYRNLFDKIDLHPRDIIHPDNYEQVPVLRRIDLQKNFDDLISVDAKPRDLRLSTTGGSTGEPVKVYHQKKVVRAAMAWRMFSWWGISPGADFASVYRVISPSRSARLLDRIIWWPTKKIHLNAASMDNKSMRAFVPKFNKYRPKYLHGYVGAIDHLASFIEDNNIPVVSPKAIWVTSSPLTSTQERRIEKVFGAPVYDQYGCCEMFWLAAQCPHKGPLHMFYDTKKFEFLDDEGNCYPKGKMGAICITDLENYYFPLIRYLNNDMGRALPGICSCGVTLPLMDKVRGRISDLIKLPNGKRIGGDYMTTIFDEWPDAIKQFQVYQRADYSIKIIVVPNPMCSDTDKILSRVRERICQDVDMQVPVHIEKTAHISQKGGKLRFVKSDVL